MDIGIALVWVGAGALLGPLIGGAIVARAIISAEERLSAQIGSLPHHIAHMRIEALVAESQERSQVSNRRTSARAPSGRPELP